MKIKNFLMVLLISVFMFGQLSQARQMGHISQARQMPISTSLKEGVYKVSPEHKGVYRKIRLLTPDKPVTIAILDAGGTLIFFVRLTNDKENIKIGPVDRGETLFINGEGEILMEH